LRKNVTTNPCLYGACRQFKGAGGLGDTQKSDKRRDGVTESKPGGPGGSG